jgi:hypothetical protein
VRRAFLSAGIWSFGSRTSVSESASRGIDPWPDYSKLVTPKIRSAIEAKLTHAMENEAADKAPSSSRRII